MQTLQRQESSEMDPFLPDIDSEPEPERERVGVARVMGYDIDSSNPDLAGQHSDDEEVEEGMTTSALLPGSDIF
jgi:hypothetical protein